jgi:hypothetical protein
VLNSRKAALEDEMTVSTMKREAARLYELLAEAEAGLNTVLPVIIKKFPYPLHAVLSSSPQFGIAFYQSNLSTAPPR